jgi:hypothetical protein
MDGYGAAQQSRQPQLHREDVLLVFDRYAMR